MTQITKLNKFVVFIYYINIAHIFKNLTKINKFVNLCILDFVDFNKLV